MKTYENENGTVYWATKAWATRKANQLHAEGDPTFWVVGWKYEKGWFLEDLEQIEQIPV